ncbi:MAG: hypothetical protein RI564_12405 [Gracilimonas sp.]|nr:hypothetical protein [Gracilimonas sp.]
MNIEILDTAEQDLRNGFHFYENIEVGLGDYFLDTIFADIDSLELDAGIHVKRYGKYHCLLSKTFPFAIYYTIAEDTVCIPCSIRLSSKSR